MKNKILILITVILLLMGIQPAISGLTEDVSYSMYFHKSAYAEPNQKFAQFKQELKQRDLNQVKVLRRERLKAKMAELLFRENEEYKTMLKYAPSVYPGNTTSCELLANMNRPVVVSDNCSPWIMGPWRMKVEILLGMYPEPRYVQRVVGSEYFYTPYNLPRPGLRMDFLATLNKETRLVDYSHAYLDVGFDPKYWLFQESWN